MYAKLFEVFENYIQACRRINSLLLDSRLHGGIADLKHRDFVKEFEKAKEFEELTQEVPNHEKIKKLGWEWQPEKPLRGGGYIVGPTYLHNFFENTGIYQHIRRGEDFGISKVFDMFLEETEKQIEVTYWGRLLGIAVEFGDQKQIDFGEFSIENLDDKNPDCVINPYIVKRILVKAPGDSGDFYAKTSTLGFIINLYCPNPAFVTWNYESNNLFSSNYNPHEICGCQDYDAIWSNEELRALIADELRAGGGGRFLDSSVPLLDDPEFVKETGVDSQKFFELEAMIGPELEEMEEGEEYKNRWFDFLNKAERYFVKRGLLANWIPEADIPKFRKFIDEVGRFMQSESYDKQEYIRIAVEFFEESYRKLADREKRFHISNYGGLQNPISIVNHIITLEALYCVGIGELREKLSNSVANLIGRTQLKKAIVRENILEIYKIRSRYLHGVPVKISQKFKNRFNIKGDGIGSRKLEIWLRDIVRRSILSFFSLCRYYKSNNEREGLLDILSNPFADREISDIQKQASEFLDLCPETEDMVQKLRRDLGKEPGGPKVV